MTTRRSFTQYITDAGALAGLGSLFSASAQGSLESARILVGFPAGRHDRRHGAPHC